MDGNLRREGGEYVTSVRHQINEAFLGENTSFNKET